MNYFGTAIFSGNPVATVYLIEVETASHRRLIEIAKEFDYEINETEDE